MALFHKILLFIFLMIGQHHLIGQEVKSRYTKLDKAATKLEDGMQRLDANQTAEAFSSIGASYEEQGDLKKALEYYRKSEKLFSQQGNQKALSSILRKIAKIEESLGLLPLAAKSYEEAEKANSNSNPIKSEINNIDIERTKSSASPAQDEKLLNKKINILSGISTDSSASNPTNGIEIDQNKELYDSYIQLANSQAQQMRYTDAITNIKNAQHIVAGETDKVMALNNEITHLYLKSNKPDDAIDIQLQALKDKKISSLPHQKMMITEKIGELYLEKKDNEKAIQFFDESYQLAIQSGQTIKARDLLIRLGKLYRSGGRSKKADEMEMAFLNDLQTMLSKDSTLTDELKIKAAEEKINTLETEKNLNDHLISKQNTINYLLIFGIVLLIVFLFLILKAYQKSERANMIIELQSLRREMNPHFIFNSLNTINHFISTHSEMEANNFLTRFSTLMRSILDNSNKNFIQLEEEIGLVKSYLELEHQRFNDSFDFTIEIKPQIDVTHLFIPNMLIQPYLENAIWHGLRYKTEKGILKLVIDMNDDSLVVTIEDNGIGIKESQAIKTEHQKNKNSVSTKNIEKRINLLYKLYQIPIHVSTTPLYMNTGTKITIVIPFIDEAHLQNKWKQGLER